MNLGGRAWTWLFYVPATVSNAAGLGCLWQLDAQLHQRRPAGCRRGTARRRESVTHLGGLAFYA